MRRQTEKRNHNFGAPKPSSNAPASSALQQKRPTVVSRAIEKEKEKEKEKDDFDEESDDEMESEDDDDDDDDAYSLKSSYDAEVACKHMENPPASMGKLN